MELTIETKKDIQEVFENNPKVREILFFSDEERKNSPEKNNAYYEEIEKIRVYGTSNFSAEEVLECFEIDSLDYLYNQAIKKDNYARIYSEIIGNGPNPYTIKDEINTLFDDDERTKEELLKVDNDTMQNIGRYGGSGFTAKEVIRYYDSNKMEELRKRAEKKLMYKEIYNEVVYNAGTNK